MLRARVLRTPTEASPAATSKDLPGPPLQFPTGCGPALRRCCCCRCTPPGTRANCKRSRGSKTTRGCRTDAARKLEHELMVAKHEAWILTDPASKKIAIWPNDKEMPMIEARWHPQNGDLCHRRQNSHAQGQQGSAVWLISERKPMLRTCSGPTPMEKSARWSTLTEVWPKRKPYHHGRAAGGSCSPQAPPMWSAASVSDFRQLLFGQSHSNDIHNHEVYQSVGLLSHATTAPARHATLHSSLTYACTCVGQLLFARHLRPSQGHSSRAVVNKPHCSPTKQLKSGWHASAIRSSGYTGHFSVLEMFTGELRTQEIYILTERAELRLWFSFVTDAEYIVWLPRINRRMSCGRRNAPHP